jgi:hypothetical protein
MSRARRASTLVAMKTQSREVTEGLAWIREQVGDDVEAGQIFRPRGAWGDAPRRFRRFMWRLGLGGDFHPLERRMRLLNLAVLRQGRLELHALRGRVNGFELAERITDLPLEPLRVRSQRRTANAKSFHGGSGTTSLYKSRIVIATIEGPGQRPLQIDFPSAKLTSHLLRALRRP